MRKISSSYVGVLPLVVLVVVIAAAKTLGDCKTKSCVEIKFAVDDTTKMRKYCVLNSYDDTLKVYKGFAFSDVYAVSPIYGEEAKAGKPTSTKVMGNRFECSGTRDCTDIPKTEKTSGAVIKYLKTESEAINFPNKCVAESQQE